jgi:hypothetical protein
MLRGIFLSYPYPFFESLGRNTSSIYEVGTFVSVKLKTSILPLVKPLFAMNQVASLAMAFELLNSLNCEPHKKCMKT